MHSSLFWSQNSQILFIRIKADIIRSKMKRHPRISRNMNSLVVLDISLPAVYQLLTSYASLSRKRIFSWRFFKRRAVIINHFWLLFLSLLRQRIQNCQPLFRAPWFSLHLWCFLLFTWFLPRKSMLVIHAQQPMLLLENLKPFLSTTYGQRKWHRPW